MAEISIDLEKMTATVKPRVAAKYARKLVNDWLKENTPYRGGWEVHIMNLHKPLSGYYDMRLINPYRRVAESGRSELPAHFDRTHFTAVTIGDRKFVYCPVGNICSWSEGDYDNKWCHWCQKFFEELK